MRVSQGVVEANALDGCLTGREIGREGGMTKWFNKLLLLFWPWSEIDDLEKALMSQNKMLIAATDRYDSAYRDGFTHHLQRWMANANMFYGLDPFSDHQKQCMIDMYNRGMTSQEALQMLRTAEGRDQLWNMRQN